MHELVLVQLGYRVAFTYEILQDIEYPKPLQYSSFSLLFLVPFTIWNWHCPGLLKSLNRKKYMKQFNLGLTF